MDIDKPFESPVEASSEPSESIPATIISSVSHAGLSQAAGMLHDFRLAESLTQLIQALTRTLPEILNSCGCGYLTWVQSPRMGVRWEAATGELGGLLENVALGIDVSVAAILKSDNFSIFSQADDGNARGIDALMQQANCSGLLLLPVNIEGDVRGSLVLGREIGAAPWTEEEAAAGFEMVELAVSLHVTRINLLKAEQHVKELERVFLASLDLTATLDPEDVLHSILKNALALIPTASDAHIFDYNDQKLSFAAALFQDGSTGQVWSMPRENGLTYTVARSGEMIVVEDIRSHPLFQDTPESWTGSIVGMPLKMKGQVIGVMTLALLEPYSFHNTYLRQLRLLADQAGIALQNARLHNLICEEAHTDWLTGLPNRRAFELAITQLIDQSGDLSGGFTLMMLDLDHFKEINDEYGHRIGDEALRRIARRLKELVRPTDFFARLGGDEFAVLMPETSIEEAYLLGMKLQQHVSGCDLALPEGKFTCVSTSIGLANYPKSGKTPEELLEAADSKLYADKAHG